MSESVGKAVVNRRYSTLSLTVRANISIISYVVLKKSNILRVKCADRYIQYYCAKDFKKAKEEMRYSIKRYFDFQVRLI